MRSNRFVALAALLVAGAGVGTATGTALPPPQEPFFDWSTQKFPPQEYAARRERLIDRLGASRGGIFLAPSRPGRSGGDTFRQLDDFLYFTGLELPDSVLAIDADTRETLLFMPREDTRFYSGERPNDFPGRNLLADPEIERRAGGAFVRDIEEMPALLAEWARDRQLWLNPGWAGPLVRRPLQPVGALGPEENLVEYVRSRHPQARLLNAYPEIAQLRMIKSTNEIEAIWEAVQATAVSIRRAVGELRPGIDERSLQGEFEAGCRASGAQRVPFTPIVKSGPNSLWPWRVLASHYDRRNRRMRAGELVIFDVGCERDYYVADVGRTFPVSGSFTSGQQRILEMEVRVADAIIEAVRPGVTLGQLQEIGEAAIPAEQRRFMQAGLFFGHHIGLTTGDPSMAETPLAEGMVFTVEPWYYNHELEIAVFTEDVILVTEDGARNLSASLPRQPLGLARLVPRIITQ